MGTWGTALFSDDLSCDVRTEYNTLLALGKENDEAEKILIEYYSSILGKDDDDESVFWLALAYVEWKKGRLSEFVKEKALYHIESGRDLKSWMRNGTAKEVKERGKVLEKIRNMILSPMPEKKKVRKPSVRHCPWEVGSLLAYKITSNKEHLKDHPCFNKYALLRVIMIKRHPISKLTSNELYNESMLVGLYGWIGDKIPDYDIVDTLDFIPVKDYMPKSPPGEVDWSLLNGLPNEVQVNVKESIGRLFSHRVETCADLNWVPNKYETADITYLGCDKSFQEKIPEFFDTSITAYSMTHFLPFDVTLANRLKPYLNK